MNKKQVQKYLSVIRRACDLISQELDSEVSEAFEEVAERLPVALKQDYEKPTPIMPGEARPIGVGTIQTPNDDEEKKRHIIARNKHIDALLGIEEWVPAIPQFQADYIVTELDQINRANTILDMTLGTSVEGAKFLDYGCGDGYIALQMVDRGVVGVTGYDITPSDCWQKLGSEIVNYTCDVNALIPQGHDLILLYDVLDHSADPEGVMKHIKYLSAPGASIYIRCHPWTSRHASHLPKSGLNKAYIHMFLTYEELVGKGFKPLFTRIEKNPLEAYRWWFKDFKIVKEKPIYENVSEFFKVPAFKELLASEQQISMKDVDGLLKNMEIQYVDFLLENPG
jgi:SAM-dependent methyltransferase